jgi:hypothetical protein
VHELRPEQRVEEPVIPVPDRSRVEPLDEEVVRDESFQQV